MQTKVETPSTLPALITLEWEKFLENENAGRERGVQKNIYASAFTPCARKMTLAITPGHTLPPWPPETLAKFRRGQDREANIIADLKLIGRRSDPQFTVEKQQERFEIRDRKSRIAITGKVDGRIIVGQQFYPFEVKSWNPNLTANIKEFKDLFENRWTRGGAYQLLMYLYGASVNKGFLILDRPGIPLILEANLWTDGNDKRVDEFLDLAELAMTHKERSEETGQEILPPHIEDVSVCKHCDYCGVYCNPPKLTGQGATIILDDELAAALDKRAELQPASKNFEKVDKEIKEKLKGTEMGLCGNWLIEGAYSKMTKVVWPDEETKKKFQVIDPKGKFTLSFTRIGFEKESNEA